MAGKKGAAATKKTAATKRAATKKAATAAAAAAKKPKIGSVAAAADNKKYHVLNLIPIKEAEYIALLREKGVDCKARDEPHEDEIKRNPITLKLPLNYTHIAEDFIDDYHSDDEKKSKKPDTVRYHFPDENDFYEYSVVMKLGRSHIFNQYSVQKLSKEKKEKSVIILSQKLCYIGLTNNGDAWIEMCQKPSNHLVQIDGKTIVDPKGMQNFSLHNGSVVTFFHQKMGLAYRVEIKSSVLAKREHALSRIDSVITKHSECAVCKEPYDPDDEARQPIRGFCGHHICDGCVDGYYISQLEGKSKKLRFLKCPMCNGEKSFDVQNKVKDRILCDLIKERALKSTDGATNQVAEKPSTDSWKQTSSEVAMLRKEIDRQKDEIEDLRKRNEELEKLALENAQLRKRIEELESKPKAEAAGSETEDTDDSDFQYDEDNGVDDVPVSHNTPDASEEQVSPPTPPNNKWACTRCTLWNSMRRKKCEMCKSKRQGQ